MKEQKYILTDIDGVCLDWQKQFEKFLQFHHPDNLSIFYKVLSF
mgnify:CR=1 FL=1